MTHLSRHTKTACCWILTLLALTAIRYAIPAHVGDTYLIHNAIAESILDGNKWGLHALVKLVDIPLLPTMGLVLSRLIAIPLGLHPATLLTALSQALLLLLLITAIPRKQHLARYALAAICLLPAIPLFRNLILTNDPNWISAIPFAGALLALDTYRGHHELKSLLAAAISLSLMVFCGPTLLICSCLILAVVTVKLRPTEPQGSICLLWMPFIYALIMWLPWTLNPQDNFILTFFRNLSHASGQAFVPPFAWQPFTAAAVASLILAMKTKDNLTASCLLPVLVAIPCFAAITNAAGIANPAVEAAIIVALACLLINAFSKHDFIEKVPHPGEKTSNRTPQIAALLALLLMMGTAIRHPQVSFKTKSMPKLVLKEAYKTQTTPVDLFDSRDAPTPQMLIGLADSQWKGSRIVTPGNRLSQKVYPEPSQNHFVPLADYTPRNFKRIAEKECVHLIVPPNDGRFYGRKSHLAKIHEQGAPYLFLVAQLDHGWQLWRSIIPLPQRKKN